MNPLLNIWLLLGENNNLKKIGIGLIGLGMISENHIKGYSKIKERANIVAICDVRKDLAKKRAEELRVKNWYTNYQEMIKREDIDAVDIMVPHHLHAKIAKDVAESGKHIFIEKPIARYVKESREILHAAKKARIKLMVANNLLFHPAVKKATQLIKEGYLGKIHLAKAWSLGWFFYHVGVSKYRGSIKETGGGCFIDTGTHFVYLLRNMVGDLDNVAAFIGNILNPLHKSIDQIDFVPEGEDNAIALLKFKNSALGELTISYSTRLEGWEMFWPVGWDQRINIYGSEGGLYLDLPRNNLSLFSEKRNIPKEVKGRSYIPLEQNFGSTFDREVEHFVECLQEEREFMDGVTGEDALKDIEIVEAAYISARENKSISLPLYE